MQRSCIRGLVWLLLSVASVAVAAELDEEQPPSAPTEVNVSSDAEDRPKYRTESIRGKVVWLAEVLQQRYGMKTVAEAQDRVLALETETGDLHVIFEDLRGRSFRTDERLRQMDVELLVRRYPKSPVLQIVRVHEIKDGQKFIVDYWCDICAIVMFEDGPCSCCQDHNRLRKRLVEEKPTD